MLSPGMCHCHHIGVWPGTLVVQTACLTPLPGNSGPANALFIHLILNRELVHSSLNT